MATKTKKSKTKAKAKKQTSALPKVLKSPNPPSEVAFFEQTPLTPYEKAYAQLLKVVETIDKKKDELSDVGKKISKTTDDIDGAYKFLSDVEKQFAKDIEKAESEKDKKRLENEMAKVRADVEKLVAIRRKELARLVKRQENLKGVIKKLELKLTSAKAKVSSLKRQQKASARTSAYVATSVSNKEWQRVQEGWFKNGRFSFNGWNFDVYVVSFSYSWSLATKGSSQARQKKVTYPFRATQSDLNVTLQFESREKLLEFGDFARAYHEAVTSVAGKVGDLVPNMNFKLKLNGQDSRGYADDLYIDYDVALPSIPIAQSNDSVAPTMRLTLKILRDQAGNLDYIPKKTKTPKRKKKNTKPNSKNVSGSKDKDVVFVSSTAGSGNGGAMGGFGVGGADGSGSGESWIGFYEDSPQVLSEDGFFFDTRKIKKGKK